MSGTAPAAERAFDGVVCIGGEDWWYHNRGHFDFQIMRRLAQNWPVLFVNSLGVRMPNPSEGSRFLARVGRKLGSLSRGLVRVENEFWVLSPVVAPGQAGGRLSGWALAPQIKRAAVRAGIRRPLLWVHCPAGARLVGDLAPVATVLQRTDRFEAFPDGDAVALGSQLATLKKAADLVIYAAPDLCREEATAVRRALLVTHGVDFETFARAGRAAADPADVASLPRPRVGFVGGIDAHTFDPELFLAVARRLPECRFVLIGGCSLPEAWCTLPNVERLGRKPYEAVAAYMTAMDVLIMPWNKSEWIRACNPIKLKEYLAVGRPVVTTDFPALGPWRDLVRVADDADAFTAAIRQALVRPCAADRAHRRLASEGWDSKAEQIRAAFASLGLTVAGSVGKAASAA